MKAPRTALCLCRARLPRRAAFLHRPTVQPSFRTKQADFSFPVRSCAFFASRMVLRDEPVGLRRDKSLFAFAFVGPAFLGGPIRWKPCFAVAVPSGVYPGSRQGGRPLFLIHLLPHCHSERNRPIFSFPFAPAKGPACGGEESLLGFAFVGPAFLGGPLAQSSVAPPFSALPQRPAFTPIPSGRPIRLDPPSPNCHSERSGPIFSFPFAPAKGPACGGEESLLGFAFVGPAFLGGPLALLSPSEPLLP